MYAAGRVFFNKFPGIPGKTTTTQNQNICSGEGISARDSRVIPGEYPGIAQASPSQIWGILRPIKPPMFYTFFSWGFLGNVKSDPLIMYKKKSVDPPRYTLIEAGNIHLISLSHHLSRNTHLTPLISQPLTYYHSSRAGHQIQIIIIIPLIILHLPHNISNLRKHNLNNIYKSKNSKLHYLFPYLHFQMLKIF